MIQRLPASRIALIAILAIVWHALMPLAHAMTAGQDLLSSICSTGSLGTASGKQQAPTVDLLKQCPLCASGAHAALSGEPLQGFASVTAFGHVRIPAVPLSARHALPWLFFSSRAPPEA